MSQAFFSVNASNANQQGTFYLQTVVELYRNTTDIELEIDQITNTPESLLSEQILACHHKVKSLLSSLSKFTMSCSTNPEFSKDQGRLEKKVIKIQEKIAPLMAKIPPQKISSSKERNQLQVLKEISRDLQTNPMRVKYHIEQNSQLELHVKIFKNMWQVMGEPLDIHSDYGRAAFLDEDTLSAPFDKKVLAIQFAQLDIISELIQKDEKTAVVLFKEFIPQEIQHQTFGKVWEVMGRPQGHPNYGKAAFYGEDGIQISKEKKFDAIEALRKNILMVSRQISHILPVAQSHTMNSVTAVTPLMIGKDSQIDSITSLATSQNFIAFYDERTNATTAFLGNFYPCNIEFGGIKFENSEATFQAQKFTGNSSRKDLAIEFSKKNGNKAFNLAKDNQQVWRQDWHVIKEQIMAHVLYAKFTQNQKLKSMLLATGAAYLVEHNPVKGRDTYWSDDHDGTGQNKLGTLLMQLREKLGGNGIVARPSQYDHFVSGNNASHFSTKQTSSQPTCSWDGCNQSVYSQIHNKFCGKTHAQAYMKKYTVLPCSLKNCKLPRHKELSGKVHEFCGKTHARQAGCKV